MRTWWLWLVVMGLGCVRAFPPLEVTKLPTAKEHPDAKYVVLLDETEAEFVPDGPGGAPQVVLTSRWRVKVLKATVLPPIEAHYSRSFTQVERIRGRVVKADGTEEPLDLSKRTDLPAFDNNVLITDERVVVVPVPPLPVGAVYEQEVVTRRLDVKPYVLRERFGDDVPVALSRVIVSVPKDWLIRWTLLSFDGKPFAPKEELRGERKVWTFERENLPAIEPEAQGPPVWALAPTLAVRLEEWTERGEKQHAFASPEALSTWLAAEYEAQAAVSPELVTTVKEVLAGVPDSPEAKARALYEHTCRTIQYCAIEIGYGGWIPHASAQVQKLRYGDCKDKATYLHALLKVANISSAPTLIYAHDGTPMPFQLPSLGANFNHAILAIDLPDGRVVYADPTHRTVPFGELPPSDQGATVLELRPEGAALKRTPESEPSTNVERETLRLRLDARGDGTGVDTLETKGANALPMKNRLVLGTGLLKEWFGKQLWARSAFATDAKPVVSGDFADTVSMEGPVSVRHLFAHGPQGDSLIRVSDVFDAWLKTWPASRRTDVVTRFAQTQQASLVLELPTGFELRALPADVKIESAVGDYTLRWRQTPTGLTMERTLTRKHRVIPVASIPDANRFASQVLLAEHRAVVVKLPVDVEASR